MNFNLRQAALLEKDDVFQLLGDVKIYKIKKIWYDYKQNKIGIKVGIFKKLYISGYLRVLLFCRQ